MSSKDFNQILTKRFLDRKDALTKGYFLVYFDQIPDGLAEFLGKAPNSSTREMSLELSMSCRAATLPDSTIKETVFTGRGGMTREPPISSTYGKTVSLSFNVDQKTNPSKIINGWYDYLVALYRGEFTSKSFTNNKSSIYGCVFYFWVLLPNFENIIYAFSGEGCYPLKKVTPDYGMELGSNEVIQHTTDFHIDYFKEWFYECDSNKWIKTNCEQYTKMFKNII